MNAWVNSLPLCITTMIYFYYEKLMVISHKKQNTLPQLYMYGAPTPLYSNYINKLLFY